MLVLTSCTSDKVLKHENPLTLDDFRDPVRLREREKELLRLPAGELYDGRQHRELMKGIGLLRTHFGHDAVTLRIVSAGYGLVSEDQMLAPYDASFNPPMRKQAALDWSKQLNVPNDVRAIIKEYPLVVFLLGGRYLEVIEPPLVPVTGQRFIFFAKPSIEKILCRSGVTVVPAGQDAAAEFKSTSSALKGIQLRILAAALVHEGQQLRDSMQRSDSPEVIVQALQRWRKRDKSIETEG